MAGFSFAQHEDDPLYSVKNPGMATAEGVGKGTATGTAIGSAIGTMVGLTRGKGIGSTLAHAGVGTLVGAGAGGALGYHHVDKKRDAIERAYGKVDPFELQKLSAIIDERLKLAALTVPKQASFDSLEAAYQAGAEFAMKLAASQNVPAMPFTVDHPYLSNATHEGVGMLAGGLGGAALGALAGPEGAMLGGMGGMLGGALMGHGTSVLHHYHDKLRYQQALRDRGLPDDLPFAVDHPYLARYGAAMAGAPPTLGAAALHYYQKDQMQRDLRRAAEKSASLIEQVASLRGRS